MRHAGTGRGTAVSLSLLGTGKHYYSDPVDLYLAAVKVGPSNQWLQVSLLTALASVIGGGVGWYLGFALQK